MQQLKFLFLLIIFMVVNLTDSFGQTELNPDAKSSAHIGRFKSDFIKSMLNGDQVLLKPYYAENIRLMPEFQLTIMGKANALLYYQALHSRFEIQGYTRNELKILDLGKRILELGFFTMKMKSKSTGKLLEFKGKYQNIWGKSQSGNLTLLTESWNYNHQIEHPEQLKFSEVPAVNVALQAHVPINNPISFELAALNRFQEIVISQYDHKIWAQYYLDDARFIYSNSSMV
jgi:ketosteroid isomerase-like protein